MGLLAVGPLPTDPEAIAAARDAARLDHNAVPFATLARQLGAGPTRDAAVQLVGNLLLLVPLGVYGPALFSVLRSAPAILVMAAAVSAAIELGQLALSGLYGFPIRIADIDDVILNTAGALLGFFAWRLWTAASTPGSGEVARSPR